MELWQFLMYCHPIPLKNHLNLIGLVLGRKRRTNKHLPVNVYLRRGRYQLRFTDGTAKTFQTLDELLPAWAAEYGDQIGNRFKDVQLDYRAKVLPTKAASTRKEYNKALVNLTDVFGPVAIDQIRPMHIYQYQDGRAAEGAKVTVNREIAVLSGVFNHAIRLGHIDFNPCRQVRRRPEKPRDRYVTDDELAIVYGLASEWMQRAIRIVCITGIRLGDLCRIGPDNHVEDGFLYQQGKTGRKILIEWTDELREAAQRPPVSYEGFSTAWQRLMKKAMTKGIKNEDGTYTKLQERFTFHDLRAKAGSEAIDWRLLGHTDRHTFERIYNRKPVRIKNESHN